jgi:hypothetical protein
LVPKISGGKGQDPKERQVWIAKPLITILRRFEWLDLEEEGRGVDYMR